MSNSQLKSLPFRPPTACLRSPLAHRTISNWLVSQDCVRSVVAANRFSFFRGLAQGRECLRMKSVVVVGAQWGDEGKGKVVDYLSGAFDYIARVAGGHNAGHTVIIGKDRFVLQLIPCGILRPKQHAVIGAGVVIAP